MVTGNTADNTLNKTQVSSKKELRPPPPGNISPGPLTPVDSPRAAIEKIIQRKSPGKGEGGVARS